MTKQIVKALKKDGQFYIQFKNNFESRFNHVLEEKGMTKLFITEQEAIEYAKSKLPKWMFV